MHDRTFEPLVFAENIIKDTRFLVMLQLFLFPQVDDLPNAGDIYIQLDRAPPHYSDLVKAALDEKFPNKWIGRSGPIPWPPRSLGLTVLDFFFRWHINNIMYAEEIRDLQHLTDRICAAIETVTPQMLSRV
jgi:hypothetical protein